MKDYSKMCVYDWPLAPCERCGRPSRIVGACEGKGECITCTLRYRGETAFEMNDMHQPVLEENE